ncbi:hypothetical protein ON010_g3497 [Phytophthora cinnamomi]|nr:hypothetical protein ON010_g3497 [Phytophthora cinnamomi]
MPSARTPHAPRCTTPPARSASRSPSTRSTRTARTDERSARRLVANRRALRRCELQMEIAAADSDSDSTGLSNEC